MSKNRRFVQITIFLGILLLSASWTKAAHVQTVSNRVGNSSTFSVAFTAPTTAGNLIIVGFDFYKSGSFKSITDSQGNTFSQIGSQLSTPGGSASRLYYAAGIRGGSETITVTLAASSPYLEVYAGEFSGVVAVDAQAGDFGTVGAVSSGSAFTTATGDTLYGYCVSDGQCSAGSGFTLRGNLDGNITQDKVSGAPGAYAVTGNSTGGWSVHMVALRGSGGSNGTPPVITSPNAATGVVGTPFAYQITATSVPTIFGAIGLPVGVSFNQSTGTISGTPQVAATWSATVSATNSFGTGSSPLTITVVPVSTGMTPETIIDNGTVTFSAGTLLPGKCYALQLSSPAANPATMHAVIGSNTDLTTILGYAPSTSGVPMFYNPTVLAGFVNIKVCNDTPSSVTTGAFPLWWMVEAP